MFTNNDPIPWKRFWISSEKEPYCDHNGFLVRPDEGSKFFTPDSFELRELLRRKRLLILRGPAGSGKSHELKACCRELTTSSASGHSRKVIYHHSSEFGKGSQLDSLTVRSPHWKEANAGGTELVLCIDAMDEALILEQSLLEQFVGLLQHSSVEGVSLVIASRHAAWEHTTAQSLSGFWKQDLSSSIYDLCPLRRDDIRLALGERWEEFLRQLEKHDATSLGCWPITLRMTVRKFQDDGDLGVSRFDFFEETVRTLLVEWDEKREKKLRRVFPEMTIDERWRTASRIAAQMILGARSGLELSNHADLSEFLCYSDVLAGDGRESMPMGEPWKLSPDTIDSVAYSNLFLQTSNQAGSTLVVRFSHRTFAELLAADYIGQLPIGEIQKLCTVFVEGAGIQIVPQLIPVIAWVACCPDQDGIFQWVLELQPEALLQADLSLFSDDQKKQIVRELLRLSGTGEVFLRHTPSTVLRGLSFSGLGKLLLPIIEGKQTDHQSRAFAFDFAGACKLEELEPALRGIVYRVNDPYRVEALGALSKIGIAVDRHSDLLFKLAQGKAGKDPSDDLKGIALKILLESGIPLVDLLSCLSRPKRSSHYGLYDSFLVRSLSLAMVEEDIPEYLQFLSTIRGCFDEGSSFQEFADEVFVRACKRISDPDISNPLVSLWLGKARQHEPMPGEAQVLGEKTDVFAGKRNDFFLAVMNHPATIREDVWTRIPVEDCFTLRWVLEEFPNFPADRREIWVEALRNLAFQNEEREQLRDLLQRRYEDYAEIRARFPPVTKPGLDLHATLVRFERAGRLRLDRKRRGYERLENRARNRRPSPEEMFSRGVEFLESGNIAAWAYLTHAVLLKSGGVSWSRIRFEEHDFYLSRTNEEKKLIRNAARSFLIELEEHRNRQLDATNYSHAAYYAVSWLRQDLSLDMELRNAVTKKWIGAMVDFFNEEKEEHQEMIALAHQLNSSAVEDWMLRLCERHSRMPESYSISSVLKGFAVVWNARFSQRLVELISRPALSSQALRDGIKFLAKVDYTSAEEYVCKEWARLRSTGKELDTERKRAYVATALLQLPMATWKEMFPVLDRSRRNGKRLFLENVREIDSYDKSCLANLNSEFVADLRGLLVRLFPLSDDPPKSEEMTFITSDEECRYFRQRCLDLLVDRGAIQELNMLQQRLGRGSDGVSSWYLRRALELKVRGTWQPLAPDHLVHLVHRPNATLARTNQELADAIIASLCRLEEDWRVQHVGRLWDGDKPKLEKDLSREIQSWLASDLKECIVDRELAVNRLEQQVDILVRSKGKSSPGEEPLAVVIEVKRSHDRRIPKSIVEQLYEKYLRSNALWSHGIYLIGWFNSKGRWEKRCKLGKETLEASREELNRLCADASDKTGKQITGIILDCRNPA